MTSLHIKKILVPIDFSDNSLNALCTATSIAKRNGATIKLLFVHDGYDKFYPRINLNNAHDIIKSLSTLSKLIKEEDEVQCDFSYIMGDISNCIIQESTNEKPDLIIMGKNGNSGERKTFAGSNINAVIRRCPSPVLIIPSGRIWTQFENILFPMLPAFTTLEKYVVIKEIITKNNSTIELLNLRNSNYISELHIISDLVQLLKIKFKEYNVKTSVSYYFKDDQFVDKILIATHNNKTQIDLLVITSEENSIGDTFCLSHYVQEIIHRANVPALIIKADTTSHSKDTLLKESEKKIQYD